MSSEVKETFINRLRMKLSDYCIPVQIDKILGSVSDCLFGFDIDVTVEDSTVYIGDDFLELFINALTMEGKSKHTTSQYKYILERFLREIGENIKAITAHHIRSYLSSKKEQGMEDSSLESYRLIYSSFFNWLYREGLITKNPMANVGAIKVVKKIKKSFSDTDIELLKLNGKDPRDIAIVTFLLATACRISEVVNLNIDDVNFISMECTVHGKGGKERKAYLDEQSVLFLKEYLLKRNDDNPALFVSLRNPHKRLTGDGVRYMLRKLGIEADVDHVHPHKFRRTKATNLIKHGMPIQEVAAVLGHDKLDTTMMYIAMDDNTVKHDYQKFA